MTKRIQAKTFESIESLLLSAHKSGRKALYEHEVYHILSLLGIHIPAYQLILDKDGITPETIGMFSSEKVVLKAIAPNLVHKNNAGAVDIVYKDPAFIKYSCTEMTSALTRAGYRVEGILLVEYIEYSKDLGNEILLGFRESSAFGPVISFSKGGTDAEHFATHFSTPNLILPPIDRNWTEALLKSTKIHKKFMARGRSDYIAKIVDAGMLFSRLASWYSHLEQNDSMFVIREFEVNPFVFDPSGRFIALDGYAFFDKRKKTHPGLLPEKKHTMTPFFEPKGIAVAGVSKNDPTKPGNVIAGNLLKLKRKDVFFLNPKGGTLDILGETQPLYSSLSQIDQVPDLAVIAVPADATPAIMKDCARKKVPAVILISGGFSETGKNEALEKKILAIARKNHIRIMGPNCLGVVFAGREKQQGLNTFFIPENKFILNLEKKPNVVILSQSGALGLTVVYNLRHSVSPKAVISYGNQLDVDPSDLIQYFNSDKDVAVIGCYIEGFKEYAGRMFFNTVAKSRKPIIIYKAGRTRTGQRATQSHTASIAGEYEVAKAAMKQAGAIVADTMADYGDYIKTFTLLNKFKVRGNRIAIIANAGYEKTYAADNLGDLVIATFDAKTKRGLKTILPEFVTIDPMLDLTPMADDSIYEKCIDVVLQSENVDALFVSIVPQAILIHTTDSEIDAHKDNVAARIVRIARKYKKPVVISICVTSGSDTVFNKLGQILEAGDVPTFLSAKRAMACLNAFIHYRLTKEAEDLSQRLV